MIATAHPQYQPGVMRKLIGQTVNERGSAEPNPKKTAGDGRIGETRSDVIEAAWRHFYIDMQKPKHVAVRGRRARVHLSRPTCSCLCHLITQPGGEHVRFIGAAAIHHENLGLRGAPAKLSSS